MYNLYVCCSTIQKHKFKMKKITLAMCFAATIIGMNSCSKSEKEGVDTNKATHSQVMTLAPPTLGEKHNLVMQAYEEQYGFSISTTVSYLQVQTKMHRINQIMIDQGILTSTDVNTVTEETMKQFANLGFFNSANNLKTRNEIIDILHNAIINSAIKAAHANIKNYTGVNYLDYATDQFDGLLNSSSLTVSESYMMTGAKDIFINSYGYWNNLYETQGAKAALYIQTADEIAYVWEFTMRKIAGDGDGIAGLRALAFAAKVSGMAAGVW